MAYVGTANSGADAFAASRVNTKPGGSAANDIAVFYLGRWKAGGGVFPAVTPPSGAVLLDTLAIGELQLLVYAVYVQAGDTTYTFSWTGSIWSGLWSEYFSGRAQGLTLSALARSGTTGTSATITSQSVTAAAGDDLSWGVDCHQYNGGETHTPPTSFTEVFDLEYGAAAHRDNVTAGTQTASGGTVSASQNFAVHLVALPVASGGGTTLTVSNAGQAQHPTTPALTQVHVLTVANVGQAQHPTTPALVQNSNLTVSNVGQSQAVAATALTQVHVLAVAGVGQAQHPTTPALSQVHQMTVSGVGQAQHPTVPTLAQTHVLAVAGVSQEQATAPVTLTQTHVLTVSGVGQAQNPASLTLSGPGTLAIANVAQAQRLTTPTLTQAHQLAVANVGQAQHPAPVTLAAPGNLVVAGVKQAQTVSQVTLTQAHQLVAASVIQGQSVAAATVTQDHQLIVDGISQEQGPGTTLIFVVLPGGDELDNWLTLGDLMDARATHELIMIDRVSFRHPGMVEGVFDPDLGYAPSEPKPSYYSGKATVQARQISAGQLSPAGLGTLTQLGYAVHGPVGTTIDEAAPGDIGIVNDSADPRYVGLVLIVRNVESSSFVTARRLVCTVYEPSTP